ncbi:hypothetical protein [Filifactor alocis]|uniref:hypothetical protein n=1 Tax=Filifactor alocis TaxID=143361 RepID=UPI003FA1017F
MATKSILKNIEIRDKKSAKKFVYALDRAENIKGKSVTFSKQCKDLSTEEIKKVFGVN